MSANYIHVNKNRINSNRKNKEKLPVIACRKTRSGKSVYSDKISILDREGNIVAEVVHTPEHPLPCGATVYVKCLYGAEIGDNNELQLQLRYNRSGEVLCQHQASESPTVCEVLERSDQAKES